jgi:trigger factor
MRGSVRAKKDKVQGEIEMKVDVQDLSSIEKKLTVEIPVEQVQDEYELVFKDVQKTAKLNGFRPGKAPRKIIETHFNDYIKEQVLKKLVQDTIGPALDRKQLKPIVEPAIDFGDLKLGEPFSYTVQVELKPVVELKQYKDIEIDRDVYEITDHNVEHTLEDIQNHNAVYQDLKEVRPVKHGDLLVLDLKAECEGKELADQAGKNIQYPMGQETYIPGFEKEIEGMKTGDKRSFKVKFPEDHPRKTLAGKEVEYTVEVKGLKEKALPKLDDDFAKELGEENLAALKEKTRKNLADYLERTSRLKMERVYFDKLVAANPMDAPKTMIRMRANELAETAFRRMGLKDPDKELFDKTVEEFLSRAETEVKAGFILDAIIEKEELKLTPEDEEKKIKEMAEKYQIDVEKLKDQVKDESLTHLRTQWIEEKALDFLFSVAKIKDIKADPDAAHTHSEKGDE